MIELVVVIIILGIQTAAAAGVAAGVSSATRINHAARKANKASAIANASVTSCYAVSSNIGIPLASGLPGGYTIAAHPTTRADGSIRTCSVNNANTSPATSATATIVCVN